MATISQSELLTLEACRDIELLNAELYDKFAEQFAGVEDAADLWRKTAAEERNHAYQISLAIKLKGSIGRVRAEDILAARALAGLREFHLEASRGRLSLKKALGLAIRLEQHLSRFHIECIASFTEDETRNMFHAMMKADDEHLKTLVDFEATVAG